MAAPSMSYFGPPQYTSLSLEGPGSTGTLSFINPTQANNATRDFKTDTAIPYGVIYQPPTDDEFGTTRLYSKAPLFIFRPGWQNPEDLSRYLAHIPTVNALLKRAFSNAEEPLLMSNNLREYANAVQGRENLSRLLCPSQFEKEWIYGGVSLSDVTPNGGDDSHNSLNVGVTMVRDGFAFITDSVTSNVFGIDELRQQMDLWIVFGRWPIIGVPNGWTLEPQVRLIATHKDEPPAHVYPDWQRPFARNINTVQWRVGTVMEVDVRGRESVTTRLHCNGLSEAGLDTQIANVGLSQGHVIQIANVANSARTPPMAYGRY